MTHHQRTEPLPGIAPGSHVLAAVSGGADSVALLHMLKALRDTGAVRLTVAHFEHGLRGAESLSDRDFVQELCHLWQIPCTVGQGDVREWAKSRHIGLEEAARELRRAFLHKACKEVGADCIVTAHHASDQVETVLMRLFRGSGPTGLRGMRVTHGLWRKPLLSRTREELRAYCREHSLSWREDSTNAAEGTLRNALRLRILPQIRTLWPGVDAAVCRYAQLQAMEDDYLHQAACQWLSDNAQILQGALRLQLQPLPHDAILHRALKLLAGKSAQQTDIERLSHLCKAGKGLFLLRGEAGWVAQAAGEELYLTPKDTPLSSVPVRDCTPFPPLGTLTVLPGTGLPCRNTPFVQELRADCLEGAVLRLWQEGDRMCPLGMGDKSKLLSDIFTQYRIPAPLRRRTPLLVQNGQILWVVGLCIATRASLPDGCAPKDARRLRWAPNPPVPWTETTNLGGLHE